MIKKLEQKNWDSNTEWRAIISIFIPMIISIIGVIIFAALELCTLLWISTVICIIFIIAAGLYMRHMGKRSNTWGNINII